MTMMPAAQLAGYDAALKSAALFPRPDAGYVRISGADRVDYLHRQTTNDVGLLSPERAVLTVLTSPTARIYDVLLLLAEQEAIGAVTLPGRAPATAAYFQSRIFFNDKVTVADASEEWAQFDLEGPEAGALLERVGLVRAPALDEVAAFELVGEPIQAVGQVGLAGWGYRLLAPAGASGVLATALADAGAVRLSAESHEALRVEAGLPGPEELTEDYTPLETGLRRAVSDTKGCYTGQEVLARQLTYDKVTRQMVGLRLDALASRGAQVVAAGKPAGMVTSVAQSPRYGPIALAIVKRTHAEPGSEVAVEGEGGRVGAEVMALPFDL